MQYLICRINRSDRRVYYSHFDGRHGIPGAKKTAPRFDEGMAKTIVGQLEKLDNREWYVFEDKPRAKKERPPKKVKAAQESAHA